jgi:hypothetical protein
MHSSNCDENDSSHLSSLDDGDCYLQQFYDLDDEDQREEED